MVRYEYYIEYIVEYYIIYISYYSEILCMDHMLHSILACIT